MDKTILFVGIGGRNYHKRKHFDTREPNDYKDIYDNTQIGDYILLLMQDNKKYLMEVKNKDTDSISLSNNDFNLQINKSEKWINYRILLITSQSDMYIMED